MGNVLLGRRPSRVSRLLVALTALTLLGFAAVHSGLRFIVTPSLPRGIYRVAAGTPVRGSVVMVCLPERVTQLALERGYLWDGDCPGGAVPIGKVVLGVPGDTITLSRKGVVLNERVVSNSRPCDRDSRGRSLGHYPYGTYVLGPEDLWLFSPYHPLSFDSRYFGPVPIANVLTRLEPLSISERRLPQSSSLSAGQDTLHEGLRPQPNC